jgi:hypothetical protein
MEYYYKINGIKKILHEKLKEVHLAALFDSRIFNNNTSKISEIVLPPECIHIDCNSNFDNNLKSLILPKLCEYVNCANNKLTELIIPDGCKHVDCSNNKLIELILPKSCEYLSCEKNLLTELTIIDCEHICCYSNRLTKLSIRNSKYVQCSSNSLTELIIMNCETLDCSNNKLTKLTIPKGCKEVDCTDNDINEILNYSKDCKIKCDKNIYINNMYENTNTKEVPNNQENTQVVEKKLSGLKLYINDILSVIKLFLKKLNINKNVN